MHESSTSIKMIKIMLKKRKESDTYLAADSRHRRSLQIAMKVDKVFTLAMSAARQMSLSFLLFNIIFIILPFQVFFYINIYKGQFRTSEEECSHQAVCFFMTMLRHTLQLQQHGPCSVFDERFLITHHLAQIQLPITFISFFT